MKIAEISIKRPTIVVVLFTVRNVTKPYLYSIFILAVVLVAFVMLFFLHSLRNAAIVMVSIPASLIATFIGISMFGYTLNQFNIPVIQAVNLSRPLSKRRIKRSNIFFPVRCSSFPNRDDSRGTIVNDVSKLSKVAMITTTQNCLRMSETKPEQSDANAVDVSTGIHEIISKLQQDYAKVPALWRLP